MLSRLDLRGLTGDLRAHIPRPRAATEPPVAEVQALLGEVRRRGDDALADLTERFDGVRPAQLRVPPAEMESALAGLPPLLREALEAAQANVLAYHREQLHGEARYEREGLVVRELRRPVDRAGVYVPGGAVPLISTVLMTVIPARVAGVPEVVLCSPPDRSTGKPAPAILAAAALAGVDEVYGCNGPAAIGAMAYGTESIRPVDVIVGPGNIYVSQAKREVSGVVGVPSSFAGPSEVVVVADETTPADYAAIDLIVQVEHGPDGLAWLVTWSESVADRIVAAVARLVASSPRREVILANLERNSYTALVDGPEQAIALANAIAPEHLELMTADPEALLPLVHHAGAVFTGSFAPASVGDYLAGPSHVLPTYGSARFAGALRVDDFVKHVHVVSVDEGTLARMSPHIAAIAEAEGLAAHAESVRLRGPAGRPAANAAPAAP
ncbi:MAG: histidinol dehydrogenase [Actinobacteria bacterium]|nr:histidinol dehydrogenase [Actinomycetota bacterium]